MTADTVISYAMILSTAADTVNLPSRYESFCGCRGFFSSHQV